MSNTVALEEAVRRRCEQLHAEALDLLLKELDVRVPDSGEAHADKLRDTRVISTTSYGNLITTVITYTAPTAEWTEFGTPEHDIFPKRPAYALHFYWPKMGGEVFFSHVHWTPGPGVAKNLGWFSQTVATWPDVLRDAADGLR